MENENNSHELSDPHHLTLVGHLAELRVRLVNALYGVVAMTCFAYAFSEKIFDIVRKPIQPYLSGGGLIFTGPLDKFMAHLKLSVVCGIILSCPLWLYQVWKFVAPGLYSNERRYMTAFIGSGTALFLTGVSFAYFIALPMAFEFLMNFGGSVDKPMISIGEYMGFFTQVCVIFGASFELPLILVLLGMIGLVSQQFLREKRRYAILILAIICAVITPPDLFSMLMMLVPMLLLYEIAVLIVGFLERSKARRNQT